MVLPAILVQERLVGREGEGVLEAEVDFGFVRRWRHRLRDDDVPRREESAAEVVGILRGTRSGH